jgi:hypothetical protein
MNRAGTDCVRTLLPQSVGAPGARPILAIRPTVRARNEFAECEP